ncbi:MAG: hypothetical protein HUU15_05495 [Candidatus Brocadiae bacterium]|nr:hypothetical protein [Candidatus Brocadiia bacterium]
MRLTPLLLVPALLIASAMPLSAQEDVRVKNADGPACGNGVAPAYFLPGSFTKALEKAKTDGRCLIVKGVAFGIDKEGAACGTKGHW